MVARLAAILGLAAIFALALSPTHALAGFDGSLALGTVLDDNVYRDSRRYADAGYRVRLDLASRSRPARGTYFLAWYCGEASGFRSHRLEDFILHQAGARFKRQLGDAELGLAAMSDWMILPQAREYGSWRAAAHPHLSWRFSDRNSVFGGPVVEMVSFPWSDLDSRAGGLAVGLARDLSLFTSLELSGLYRVRFFTEWPGGSARQDYESALELLAIRALAGGAVCSLACRREVVASDQGSADLGLLQNAYYSPDGEVQGSTNGYQNQASLTFRAGLSLPLGVGFRAWLSASYRDQRFSGRAALDETGLARQPETPRHDRNTSAAIALGRGPLRIGFSAARNASNDAGYDYANVSTWASLSLRL